MSVVTWDYSQGFNLERTAAVARPLAGRPGIRAAPGAERSRRRSAKCDQTVAGPAARGEGRHRGNGKGVRYHLKQWN